MRARIVVLSALAGCGEATMAVEEPQVTAIVRNAGVAVLGVNVVFHDAQGNVLAHQTTSGAGGETKFPLKTGGMVTFVFHFQDFWSARTIAGVREGSTVVVGSSKPPSRSLLYLEKIALPGLIPQVPFYSLDTGCEQLDVRDPSPANGVDVFVWGDCISGSKHQAVAFAEDERDRVAYSVLRDIELDLTRTRSLLMPPWRTDFRRFGVVIENAPAGAGSAYVHHALAGGPRLIAGQVRPLSTAGGRAEATMLQPPDLGDEMVAGVQVTFGTELGGDEYSLIELREPIATPTVTLDLAAGFLPHPSNLTLDAATPARPVLTWTAAEPAAGADGLFVALSWAPLSEWFISAPPDTPSPLQIPELPEALAAARPPEDAAGIGAQIALVDYGSIAGFEALAALVYGDGDLSLERLIRASVASRR